MKTAKLIFKASVDGDVTVEQQIINAKDDAFVAIPASAKGFASTLKYDVSRTAINILSNATIKYNGVSTPFCLSLQKKLNDIYFMLHESGQCYLRLNEKMEIEDVQKSGGIGKYKIVDPTYELTKITQKVAAEKALELYGVVSDAAFSVITQRGVLGMFSPEKDVIIKPGAATKLYAAFQSFFGITTNKNKFMLTEVPMRYSGISIPVKELELPLNKRDAIASYARIHGISEDMILSGSTFDNKENAIIQTYSDFKGLIYNWITQFHEEYVSRYNVEEYEITFPSVPQMNKPATPTIQSQQ